jgi:hypothetical protein
MLHMHMKLWGKLIEPPTIHNIVKIHLYLVGVWGDLCYVTFMFS